MNFNFGDVLTRAWQIVWRHRVLWIFGILAGCGRGGSRFNSGSSGGDGNFGDLPPEMMRFLQFIQENLTTFIVATCIVVLLLWALMIFLGTIGRIGLIRGTFQAETGAEKLIFGQLFSESTPYFWRMFGLSLLVSLPVLIVIAVLVAGLVALAVSASGGSDPGAVGLFGMIPLMIGCICLLIPILWVVGMIVRQAENAIVLEGMGVFPALSRGWEVFRANLGPVILMSIILAIIAGVIGFILAIPLFLIVFPSVIAFAVGEGQSSTPLILMGVGLCIYLPILLVLNGIMAAYIESAWTLTYMRLTAKPPLDSAPVVLEANA
ncbi:MAG TPA: hypothetical protein VFH34_09225 [Anaerolineales bacterium]|nr:hypothetical protein [Anaerolineales bacterium]